MSNVLTGCMLTLCPLKLLHVYFDTIEWFYLKTNKPRFSYYPGQISGHSEPQSTESDPCKKCLVGETTVRTNTTYANKKKKDATLSVCDVIFLVKLPALNREIL